jgi:hypothetical protein
MVQRQAPVPTSHRPRPELPRPDLDRWAAKLAASPGAIQQVGSAGLAGPAALRPPQPLRVGSAGAAVVQRYTAHRDGSKTSENGVFMTHETGHVDALDGHAVQMSTRGAAVGQGYVRWTPRFDVIGDCVAAMEEVMHGKKLKYGVPDASKYRGSKQSFGESDAKNRKRGADTDLDQHADPAPGEAYLIARQGYARREARPQFHGAAVVAQDGGDNVTLEATAPRSGAIQANRVTPIYDMYENGKRRKTRTFKTTFQAEYGEDATVSVLEPAKTLPKGALDTSAGPQVVDF